MAKNAVPKVGEGAPKPLCFIENKGQVASEVQYTLSAAGMNLYVGKGRLHYQFRKIMNPAADVPKLHTYRMDVTLLGANPNAKAEASGQQEYYENFYTSPSRPQGITAHTYSKVTYKEVYPGIDWVLYINEGKVEYDFVVRPGANASLIKLQYGGATTLSMTADGGILATTPMGKIQEKKPYAYENLTGKQVAANFKLNKNVVSFEAAKCDGTLVIDPLILWSTYFGGANEDVANCVKISPGGNAYIGGYTSSTTVQLGTSPPVHDITANGGFDAFISKYNAAGVRQFTTYFGGGGNDRGTCMAMEATGASIFLGGFTQGSAGLNSSGTVYHTTNNGLIDGFILRIDNNGTRQWSTYYGGAGNDYVYGLACDAAGNVYATGRTESAATIASAGVFQTALSGSADAFVAKFNLAAPGGNVYSTYYGGTGVDEGAGIAVDATNNAIITGQTNSIINIATAGAYQGALSGANDAFVGKLNNTGTTRLWGTYFGGPGAEQGKGAVCNTATGNIVLVGYTTSTSGVASLNSHQPAYGGGAQDAFVASLTSAGALAWSTYYGGANIDYGESVCLDPSGNFVIGGATFSTNGIASTGSLQPTLGGNYDAFMAKLTPLGQRIWGSYFGGTLYDYGFGVACDAGGQILLTGHTTSTAGIATAGAAQTVYGGGTFDAFLTKLRPDTFALINQPFVDTIVCAGGPLRVNYTTNFSFQPGNNFSVQISNASGVFPAPPANIIGTAAAVATGSVSCTIPGGTPVGTGYRIRLVASNPSYISPDNFMNISVVASLPAPTVTSNSPVCTPGGVINLSATAPWTVGTYSWAGPAAYSSASPTPSIPGVTLANDGIYTVTMTHNGCAPVTGTTDVWVNDVIPASPVASSSTLNCNGGSLNLFASTIATATYSWVGPAAFASTMQNPTISPIGAANAGSYDVVSIVDGCPSVPSSVMVTVTPNTPVSVGISVTPNDTVCGGTTVSFGATPVNGGISPSYQWMTGATPVVGALTSSWSSSTLTDGVAITVQMVSNALCPNPATAVSNVIKMNVITNEPTAYIFASPGLSVNPGDSVVFTSAVYNVGVGATYQWKRNSVDIPGATNAKYTRYGISTFDSISVVVTSTMACVTANFAKSNTLVVHPNTAVGDVSAVFGNIELFPNPNSGRFNITGSVEGISASAIGLTIMNPLGQVVYNSTAPLQNGRLENTIQTEHLPAGVYLLQLSADGMSKAIRFTVQK